ncbi:intradiol ring-cleavage dioxygenase [Streptomyces sp. NP160]|uniref:intradiol ring-cleavage dioxygenase n=1 Tax=Streptomyces sp. NP160 TaxID=2586637 RepID=UPI00111B7A95|nr:intradiol ring-cleavage dioxygenase [Streptomyces sp. NP160]TNM69123.1 intradiol ring-cleavage dioxygenase [Streptomyces sp. NP160]
MGIFRSRRGADPELRTYEGRVLPRQHEDVDDQGVAFDVATLLDRRRLLQLGGAGAAAGVLAACGSSEAASTSSSTSSTSATTASSALAEIPEETAGPYPGDGSNGPDALEESGIIRSDIRSSFGTSTTTAQGVPMTLQLDLVDLADGSAAYEGAAVYVWHCDRDGKYSMYSDGLTSENYLRGVQVADSSGRVEFTSVFPACYSGRWPHIHFEVYPDSSSITDASNAIATSQVALPQDVCDAVYATSGYEQSVTNLAQVSLATDNVFSDDQGASQTPTVTGDATSGCVVNLRVGIDATTQAATGMSAPSGGGGQGGQGGTPPDGAPGAPREQTTTS